MIRGFVDLHCHWIAGIDDGAKSIDESREMLSGLRDLGFDTVVATPHMRPGLFDSDRTSLLRAFDSAKEILALAESTLPRIRVACEHFFDDIVFQRLMNGHGVLYPGNSAALVEFAPIAFPIHVHKRFFDLHRIGIVPVLAHPERYRPVWDDKSCLEPLLDAGAVLLLDLCALVGRYGSASQRSAEALLDEQAYEAACSDAHRARDLPLVERAIARLVSLVGEGEAKRLLVQAPCGLLKNAGSEENNR